MSDALVFDRVSHAYGSRRTLRAVEFAIPCGQVTAVLGRNGAGKSTAIGLLEGFLTPSAGQVRVLDVDPARGDRTWRARTGLVLQSSSLDPVVTVRNWLDVVAAAYPDPLSVEDVLQRVDLAECAHRRIGTLSGGQQRRVDLATAILGRPEVLFLDEPTTGLDPEARRQVWCVIDTLAQHGTTVLLSTHYLDEAHRLADRILVLAAGQLIADTTPDRLRAAGGRTTVRLDVPAHLASRIASDALPRGFTAQRRGLDCTLVGRTDDVHGSVAGLLRYAAANTLDLATLEVRPSSLEDAYLALTGERLAETADG